MLRHEELYDRAFATAGDYGYGDVTPARDQPAVGA